MDRVNRQEIPTFMHFLKPFLGLALLIAFGTIGYMKIEGWSFLDAILMSVTTMTTVGYGFIHPLSQAGEIFTIIYIIFGVLLFLYFASEFAHYVFQVNFEKTFREKNMEARLKKLKDHYIVCGYGRTGAEIAAQLKSAKLDFVVVDKRPELENEAQENGFLYIIGDATNDQILEKAGINCAKGLFCALSDDVDNLYLTLSSRNLNHNLRIVTRCIKVTNEQKFVKAGANNVILPYEISGTRMVASIVKPLVVDFLDVVTHTKGGELELKLEQFKLKSGSPLENQTIISLELRQKTGIVVIAIKRDSEFITNPEPDTVLRANDDLILLGTNSQLANFENNYKGG